MRKGKKRPKGIGDISGVGKAKTKERKREKEGRRGRLSEKVTERGGREKIKGGLKVLLNLS